MYIFHRDQHMVQIIRTQSTEFFFVLLRPLVDRMANFYRLILDTLVCW